MMNLKMLTDKFTELKIDTFGNTLIDWIDKNKNCNITEIYDLLNLMCDNEIKIRKSRSSHIRLKTANFPAIKTIDDYDFTYNESVDKSKILSLSTLNFIQERQNILFIGSPGIGKTHLATSIGVLTALNKYSVYFIHAHKLVQNLHKAYLENRLEERLKKYAGYRVLIIDEVGYLPFAKDAGNLLFQLFNLRYTNKNSTVITSNLPLNKWDETFGDKVIGTAIIDRLIENCEIVTMIGKSYRTRKVFAKKEN